VDSFSKFVWLLPVREATAKVTVKALRERVFSNFSVPEVLVSDNASCFTGSVFRKFSFELGIKHVTTTPYYPQPSHAERFNRNLRSAVIAYHTDNQTTWDENFTWLQLAFNTATHDATEHTPFEIVFPFRARSPLLKWKIQELLPEKSSPRQLRCKWNEVRRALQCSHLRTVNRYNRGRKPNPLKVGDLVWVKSHPLSKSTQCVSAKLSLRWRGPYKNDAFLTPVTCRLVDPAHAGFFTRARLSQIKAAGLQ
jgi:hypothetical protein